MVKLFEEEIHIVQLFYANQSIRNVRDISNATHDRPIPSIGTIFDIISKSLVFGIVGCIATHNALLRFLKLNIGNKYGQCSELKKCPGILDDCGQVWQLCRLKVLQHEFFIFSNKRSKWRQDVKK
jgi:hypothetical protein